MGGTEPVVPAAFDSSGPLTVGSASWVVQPETGAEERELALARLTTMGHDRPAALVLAEAMPTMLAASAAGVICALALPQLVGSAVDLAVFTGQGTPVPLRPAATLTAEAAGCVTVVSPACCRHTRTNGRNTWPPSQTWAPKPRASTGTTVPIR